jgi:hypothetical protein
MRQRRAVVEISGGDRRMAVIDGRLQEASLAQLGCPAHIIEELRSLNGAPEKRTAAPASSVSSAPAAARLAAIDADYDTRNVPSADELRAKAARLAREF